MYKALASIKRLVNVKKMRKQHLAHPAEDKQSAPSPSKQQPPSQCPATGQSASSCQQPKKPQPKTLLDRIPIAGLHNYLYADGRKERIFWAFVLLFSAAITLSYLVPSMMTFLKFTTVLDLQHVTENNMPMPTFQVCVSGSLNKSYLHQEFAKYAPQLEKDKRLIELAKSYKILVKTLLFWTYGYITANPFGNTFGESEQKKGSNHANNEVIYKTVKAFSSKWPGYKSFYNGIMLPCTTVLHNCMFNNQECSVAKNMKIASWW